MFLPDHWSRHVKSALLQVISLARLACVHTWGWAAGSLDPRTRLAAQLQQARAEIALLREELRIKDGRMAQIPAHRRPHYPPTDRMAILELKAARGWNQVQAAKAMRFTSNCLCRDRHSSPKTSAYRARSSGTVIRSIAGFCVNRFDRVFRGELSGSPGRTRTQDANHSNDNDLRKTLAGSGAKSGAGQPVSDAIDPDPRRLARTGTSLPDAVRAGIVAMIQASGVFSPGVPREVRGPRR
jgi:hypothetical protein